MKRWLVSAPSYETCTGLELCVCACARVRACMRACVRACVGVGVCVDSWI